MAQNEKSPKHAWGKHRYTSVVDGCAMAAQYRRSGLTIGEFVRQTGVSRRMVLYWTQRERELATAVEAGFTEVTASLPAPAPPIAAPLPPAVSSCQPDGPAMPSTELTSSAMPAAEAPPAAAAVAPRALAAQPRHTAVEIRLPSGATIAVGRDFDPHTLRAVVGCLVAPC